MDKDIIQIVSKYNSDKADHGYWEYYQKHLPNTATKILEIGVLKGESIKTWHEIYPEAHIYGLDLFIENQIPFEADWVTWFKGSQADGKLLDEVREHGDFDVIVDDGSHWSRHIWMTFYGLIDCCKLYVVEDLHCVEEFWRQKLGAKNTMVAHMKAGTFPFKHDLYLDKIAFIYGG